MQTLPIIGALGLALVVALRSKTLREARNRPSNGTVNPSPTERLPGLSSEPTNRAFRPGTPI